MMTTPDLDAPPRPDFAAFFALDPNAPDHNLTLRNAVAAWLLAPVQDCLPQCGVGHEGGFELTRKPIPRSRRTVVPLPQNLFMINWADSAPGFSWPEDYHVTCVPEFQRMVVTASMDSPDLWGVTEIAIGSYPVGEELERGAGRIIRAWWFLGEGHERWAYVWREGLISAETAEAWRDAVWPPYVEEDEEELDETE
jgi:hypothetical protein